MPDSIRERVLSAVVTTLGVTGANKPAGLTVHRYRKRPITEDELPAAVVYAIREPVTRSDLDGNRDHALTVRVELRTTGDPPDEALDPLYVWVVGRMLADPTLGGLALDIEEKLTQWDAEQAEVVYAASAVDFEIWFTTAAGDPTAQPGD